MAIPFAFPPEDDTARLEMTLEQLLLDLFEVLRQLAPSAAPANQQPALPAQPIIAPVGGAPNRPAALPYLVSGVKTGAPSSPAAASERQSWQQLGAELRLLADQFSNKTESSQSAMSRPPRSPTTPRGGPGLAQRLLGLLLPKTLSYSAAIIFVGLRFVKHKFA